MLNYIDKKVETRLRALNVEASFYELENIFLRFLKSEIKNILEIFDRSARCDQKKENLKKCENVRLHIFDKRRIHFLRFGNMDQGKIGLASPKLFQILLNKSRDEIEQYFMESESVLDTSELKAYVYVIFDLQRFSSKLTAKTIPQALDQKKVDAHFIEALVILREKK